MSGRLKILILLLVIVSGVRLALAAWDWLEQGPIAPRVAAAMRMQSAERPYLEISPQERIRLLEKIKTVKIGDTCDQVYEKLGKPPAQLPPTTQPVGKEAGIPSNIMVGSQIIAYYIKQKKPDQFSETDDEHIYIFLDEDDLVKYVYVLRQDQPKPVHYPDPHALRHAAK